MFMTHFFRIKSFSTRRSLQALAAVLVAGAVAAGAQSHVLAALMQDSHPMLAAIGSASQGYLGVELADIDAAHQLSLRLKDQSGAIITLIDHDAPAGQIGLRVNDVVIALNGEVVSNAAILRQRLRELPAGTKLSLLISRDGNQQTIAVELADRKAVEKDVWNKIDGSSQSTSSSSGMHFFEGKGGDAPLLGGFHLPFFGGSLNVGALVEPLTAQMAAYLGVEKGLMVKQVAHKSAAEASGLKAFDIILKVGPEPISTLANWDRALRANQGKTVPVTILRDKKQQTIPFIVDSRRHS